MRVYWKNLIIDVEGDADQEYSGGMFFRVEKKLFALYIKENGGDIEYTDRDQLRADFNNKEGFLCDNSDMFLCYCRWCYDQLEEGKTFHITYWGRFFWLFHDLCHVRYHVISQQVDAYPQNEDQANLYSLDAMNERNIGFDLTWDEFESYKDDLWTRWSHPINMDEVVLFNLEQEEY